MVRKDIGRGIVQNSRLPIIRGFQETRKLNEGELILTLADGSRIPVVAV